MIYYQTYLKEVDSVKDILRDAGFTNIEETNSGAINALKGEYDYRGLYLIASTSSVGLTTKNNIETAIKVTYTFGCSRKVKLK